MLPPVRRLPRQLQGLDAGMVGLQVRPELAAEVVGQRLQAGVVQRRLTFAQVVDQQVTDRAAHDLVPVDELLGGALALGAHPAQALRRVHSECPELTHHSVEAGAAARGFAPQLLSSSSAAENAIKSPMLNCSSVPPLAARSMAAR